MDIFILRNGEQTGPFTTQTVQTLLTQGAVHTQDMAWRKGLPAWLPLGEVLNPGSEKPSEPPPAVQVSGIRHAAPSAKPATSKQKALLKYLGVEFPEKGSKEELAVLVSDAIETPRYQARLAKWNEEKIRLHSDVFADEIEHRKANRGTTYVERCQTEGDGVVKDVTKAHCQVLVESLDKRFPAWESNPKDALWHYFFPAIAEHFPSLVVGDWKSKLRFGAPPKGAATPAAKAGGTILPEVKAPGPLAAAFKGVVYGLAALGVIIGGMQLFKNNGQQQQNASSDSSSTPPPTAAKPVEAPPLPEPPKIPADAPLIAAVTPSDPVAEPAKPVEPAAPPPPEPAPAAPSTTPAPAMNETPAAPALPPANPVPAGPPTLPRMDNTPAPAVPPAAPTAAVVTAPPAPAAPKSVLTLTKPVNLQLQFGRVTLPAGTKVRFLSVDAGGLKCNFNNNIVLIPPTSTDYDGPMTIPAAAVAPAPAPGVSPAPAAPAKPVNSSDL